MKNRFLLSVIISFLFLVSCDDEGFLDSYPHGTMTEATFWKSEADAFGALVNCYMSTFNSGQVAMECRSDNSVQLYDWMDAGRTIADGTLTPYSAVSEDVWNSYYSTARACNFFLENIGKVPFTTAGLRERMEAEARVMRAYNYLYATFDFGDIPLVLKTLTVDESKEVLSESQTKIYEFILSELDVCAQVLSAEYPSNEFGRITKGACIALKARLYLYRNDYPNVLKTIKELETLGKYSLYTAGDNPYADLFSGDNQRNSEAILSVLRAEQVGKIDAGHGANGLCLLKGIAEEDPYVTLFPTGSLVDAFPTADGHLIHEAGSAYDPKNPYKNRDPRLGESLICPGDKIGHLVNGEILWDLTYDPEDENGYYSFRYDYTYTSTSGFVWKKGLDWTVWGFRNVWNCNNDVHLIRWADILLMKAEALVETTGTASLTEVCDIIDQLRDRCKGGKVHRENYRAQEDLIRLVRTERRVELSNEGLRYYDLIRWKTAQEDVAVTGSGLVGETYGAYMRRDGVGKDDKVVMIDGVPRKFVEERNFQTTKQYLLPIPQKELDFNSNLKQNPNWN